MGAWTQSRQSDPWDVWRTGVLRLVRTFWPLYGSCDLCSRKARPMARSFKASPLGHPFPRGSVVASGT